MSKPLNQDHYLIGDNPYGKEDTWLVNKDIFYSEWIKREKYSKKYDTKIATKNDIETIKNTNYKI